MASKKKSVAKKPVAKATVDNKVEKQEEVKATPVTKAAEKAAEAKTVVAKAVEKAVETVEKKAEEKKVEAKKVEAKKETATPAKKAPAKKAPAKKAEKLVPEVFIQYQGMESMQSDIIEKIKAQFVAEGHRVGNIKSLNIYLKPEDNAAYYVINDKNAGKVDLF